MERSHWCRREQSCNRRCRNTSDSRTLSSFSLFFQFSNVALFSVCAQHFSSPIYMKCLWLCGIHTVFTHSFSSIFPYTCFSRSYTSISFLFRNAFGLTTHSNSSPPEERSSQSRSKGSKNAPNVNLPKMFPDDLLLFHVNVHISLKYETSSANNRKSAQCRISATGWGDSCSLTKYQEIFGVAVDGTSIHSTAIFVKLVLQIAL